jgi:hypothetical protein
MRQIPTKSLPMMMSRNRYMKAVINYKRVSFLLLLVVSFFIAFLTTLPPSYAATITIVNLDGPGEGFNDPTPWTPTGGNPATTLGEARLNAFQFGADIWGNFLISDVEIFVDANFDPLFCNASSATLGSAGPNFVIRDFPGAPVAATWYVQALANSLFGSDLIPGASDIDATFNSDIDNNDSCLSGTNWYYGYDGQGGGDIDFVSVVLHELAHGLGFLSLVDLDTGAKNGGYDDAYMRHLEHHGADPPNYPDMTDNERVEASVSETELHWVGPNVMGVAIERLTSGRDGDHVRMYAPNPNRPGSSVSHWDTTLTPNQLMEPFYTGVKHGPDLEIELFMDLGWNINPTFAGSVDFKAFSLYNKVILEWETHSESGTAGYYLYRLDEETGKYHKVNKRLIPGLLHEPQGGIYRCVDKEALPGWTYTYKLVEVEVKGQKRTYGPYTVTIDRDDRRQSFQADLDVPWDGHSRKARGISSAKKARIAAKKSLKGAARTRVVSDMVKIAVNGSGLYYIDASEIAHAIGTSTMTVKKWIKNKELILSSQGQEVAWLAAIGNAGIFFYGEAIDNIYTNENIYWIDKGKGQDGSEMVVAKGKGPHPATGGTFYETVHAEEDLFALTALFDDPLSDYWAWDYILAGYPGYSSKNFIIVTYGVAEAETASLTVHLQGSSDTESAQDHHVVVTLNGTQIGEGYWEGALAHTLALQFDHGLLNEGENTIELTGLLDTGAPYSFFYVDSFDLAYERYYQAVDDRLFVRGDGNSVITVGGFTNSNILVFELSDPYKPKMITALTVDETSSGYQVSFRPAAPDTLYLTLTTGAVSTPLSITGDRFSNLKRKKNRADYLVITSTELIDAAQLLANYRQRQGLKAMVMDTEDIMDEFNYGLYSPEAIRDFLSFAYHNWRKAPRYVVLAGEGTFDYKNNMGYDDNLVPALLVSTPHGLFASDNRYVDVAGHDGVPDMAIGRLPVMTSEELEAVTEKIMAYERARGSWTKNILMVADDPDNSGDFPSNSDVIADILPSSYLTEKIYLSEYTISEARQQVMYGINNGALILNYIGHAGMDSLADEGILKSSDMASLVNSPELPVVTAMTCLAGRFAIPGFDSLGEQLVLHQAGGSIATWAPTGLSLNHLALILDEEFFHAVFSDKTKILGDAALKALQGYAFYDNTSYLLDIYTLLGDPALRIR